MQNTGIPHGWIVLDEDWTTIVDHNARRGVQALFGQDDSNVDGDIFACYERFDEKLEFYLMGWVASFDDAEQWLRGETPSLMVSLGI